MVLRLQIKSLLRISLVNCCLALAACSALPPAPAGFDTRHHEHFSTQLGSYGADWQIERQWYTDFDSPYLCLASPFAPRIDNPPALESATVWPVLRSRFRLDWRTDHPRLTAELNWYASHPGYMLRVTERAERYLYFVMEAVEQAGMPGELALLPIVESAYDPFAYSHGRASGMWQFIPATGSRYGMRQDWWYDGRRDVFASTEGALRYLSDLHKQFDGDWLLALAAYNSGEGRVRRAVQNNRERGLPTDFWSLKLPKETRAYVPKLLALARLVQSPQRYGVALHPVPNSAYFAGVDIGGQLDLAQAARLAGLPIDEIYRLNPGFNRWATSPDGPHRLLLPVDAAADFTAALATLPVAQRVNWQRYRVRRGDSLLSIARHFGTEVDVIRDANRIRGNLIRAGQALMIPSAHQGASHYALSATQRREKIQDTPRGAQQQSYTVRSGDSFWRIGRQFGVDHRALAKWNGMAPGDPLKPGMTLKVWTDKAAEPTPALASASAPQARSHMRKVGYTVRGGDSLARIAGRFNVDVGDILRWNRIDPNRYLQPGQKITLYIDVTNSYR